MTSHSQPPSPKLNKRYFTTDNYLLLYFFIIVDCRWSVPSENERVKLSSMAMKFTWRCHQLHQVSSALSDYVNKCIFYRFRASLRDRILAILEPSNLSFLTSVQPLASSTLTLNLTLVRVTCEYLQDARARSLSFVC